MSAVCMSFLGIIVLIARECACEWQGDFGDGNESVFTARRNASVVGHSTESGRFQSLVNKIVILL